MSRDNFYVSLRFGKMYRIQVI